MSKTLRTKSDAIKYLAEMGHLACDRIEHLENELTEAQAEIEGLRARNAILDNAIAEMTEEQSALCAEGQTITELVAAKDKLIEQMRDVLRGVCEKCPCDTRLEDTRCKDCDVGAALEAAERGE
ncbi:MAG TPA: hypothetical protein PKC25_05440 [Candidatus Rifleibacterium sp.]|nr:hypothetical protein [Candidatus Rifleibacterium sp.]